MSRSVYVFDRETGQVVPKAARRIPAAVAPHVISDHVEPFQSMVDGRMYDSKRTYEASIRARGYDIVGNEVGHLLREEPRVYGRGLDEAYARARKEHGL